jgi:hypothetical protein
MVGLRNKDLNNLYQLMRVKQSRNDLETIYWLLRDALVIHPRARLVRKHNSIPTGYLVNKNGY